MKKRMILLGVILAIASCTYAAGDDVLGAVRSWEGGFGEFEGDLVFEDAIELKEGYTVAALSRTEGEFYASNVILVLLSGSGGDFEPIAYDASFDNYLPSENVFNFLEVVDEERGLFALGYLEGSVGSGMMTEYDNYIMFRVIEGEFERLFTEFDHIYEDFFSRWYGGIDASAWSEGGVYEEMSQFELLNLDGDLPQVLQISYWREDEDDPYLYGTARLHHYAPGEVERYGDGKYVEVMGDKYIGQLQGMDDFRVKLLLGDWALWYRSDVNRAIALYDEAAALSDDSRVKDGVTHLKTELSEYVNDPPEAIALFYAGDYRGVIEEYPDSAVAGGAFFRAGGFDNYRYVVENMKDHPDWPYAVQLMCYEAVEPGGTKPRDVKRSVDAVLALVDFPEEDKAQTCAYFGDWCMRVDEDTLAREYYVKGFEVDSTGPFSDYCATQASLLYEGDGNSEEALDWAIKSVGWDTYGWFSGDAGRLISEIEVNETALPALLGDDELSFSSGDMDGDGTPELLIETRYKEGKPARSIIIGRAGDSYELLFQLPEGKYYLIYMEAALDGRPCVFTTSVEDKGTYTDFYDLIFGYFDGEYQQLGRFYGGREGEINENNWRGYFEVEEGSEGRRIRILEYDYIDGERVVKEVYGEYEFDEGAGEYLKR
jgi:hypothetical protein